MTREEGAGVAVGAAAQKDEVEDGEADGVTAGEAADERLFVLVGEFLGIVEVGGVDGMDGGLLVGGDLVEELGFQEAIVGVGVVEGHGTLVCEEDFPLGEVDHVFGAG